jgi:hypothetical protein
MRVTYDTYIQIQNDPKQCACMKQIVNILSRDRAGRDHDGECMSLGAAPITMGEMLANAHTLHVRVLHA